MKNYGIAQAKDKCYAAATVLTYWVFKCRDRQRTSAMGTKTWTYLETSICNSAEISTCLEDYLQNLCSKLNSHLRPAELTKIIKPEQRIIRINSQDEEIQELNSDKDLIFLGWQDLLVDVSKDGFTEWDVLEVCRSRASIIQVLCRLRFEEDRALGQENLDDILDVEIVNV